MGGMSSPSASAYSPSPAATGKMTGGSPQYTPASTSQYTQPQQGGPGGYGTGQPQGGYGGGYSYGGGMSRGKGFRSGGAVHEISDEDVKRILNALATARQVVKDGK